MHAQLMELGENALSPGEIDAIEEIVLLNYRVWLGRPFNHRATFRIKYRYRLVQDAFSAIGYQTGCFF
jgi:hypothetical protein